MTSQNSNSVPDRGQLESDLQEVRSSNTDPSTRHAPKKPNENSGSGGIDWLDISFYGAFPPAVWKVLTADLTAIQESYQDAGTMRSDERLPYETAEGEWLAVNQYGTGKNIRCKWLVISRGVRIGIVDNGGQYNENFPSIRVQIPGSYLLNYGHTEAIEHVRHQLKTLGFHEIRATIARIDLCADMAEEDCAEFCDLYDNQQRVTRARKCQKFEDGYTKTGFSLGTDTKLRVYDKRMEVIEQGEKRELMLRRRWGGVMPEKATRVEFQVKRELLVEQFGSADLDEVLPKLADICDWLTTSWFRFTAHRVDRDNRHQNRAADHPIWQRAKQKFQDWAGSPAASYVKPVRRVNITEARRKQTVLGSLAALFAKTGVYVENEVQLIRAAMVFIENEAADLLERYEVKSRDLAFTSALGPPIPEADIPF